MTGHGRTVEIRTGARLHFGLLATGRSAGGLGGVGMMVDRPWSVVRVRSGVAADSVKGPREVVGRVQGVLAALRENCPEGQGGRFFEIEVLETIPGHRGFGSGTQLALAVARATTAADAEWKPGDLAPGRGRRSRVGMTGFFEGGLIVDAGPFGDRLRTPHADAESSGLLGLSVPAAWRVVLVVPSGTEGCSGAAEGAAFDRVGASAPETERRLLGLVEESIIPGVEGGDFVAFASGIAEFNRVVGEHFAPVQGGVYSHPLVRGLGRILAGSDWPYFAQSSWGPAAAIFCESEASAEALEAFLRERLSSTEAEVFVAGPLNRGASVAVIDRD